MSFTEQPVIQIEKIKYFLLLKEMKKMEKRR